MTASCVSTVLGKPGSTFGAGKCTGNNAVAQAAQIDAALWQGYATMLEVVVDCCR